MSGNRNSPIHVIRASKDSGSYEVRKGYHFYKQLTRAGQAGMAVARTAACDPEIRIIAFSADDTAYPDSFVVINSSSVSKALNIDLTGNNSASFNGHITSEQEFGNLDYAAFGTFVVENGCLRIVAPAKSAITFFGTPGPF